MAKSPRRRSGKAKADAAGSKVDELLARLEAWLGKHRRRFRKGLRPGATRAELQTLEEDLGRPLPATLRTLLAWHNGQGEDFMGAFEQDWRLMGTEEIATAYGVPSKFMIMTARVTFLIDPEGKIARVWPEVDPAVDAENVLKAASELTAGGGAT